MGIGGNDMGLMSGISAPQLTPFRQDGSIDYDTYTALSAWIAGKRVKGIFVCGTTGEFANLTIAERKQLLLCAREGAGSGERLMFNVTALNLEDVAQLMDWAKAHGADCLSVTPPYYHSYDAKALIAYFTTIATIAEGMPVYLYNIPGMVKNAITPAVLAAAAQCDNIVGVKDSCMDHQNLLEYMDAVKKPGFEFITGNDAQVITALDAGACGGVIAMAGVYPELCQSIVERYEQGKREEALCAQRKVMGLRRIARSVMPVMAHKEMLRLQGFDMGVARFPFRELTQEEKAAVRRGVEELGLL